jgi:hypothetical protein
MTGFPADASSARRLTAEGSWRSGGMAGCHLNREDFNTKAPSSEIMNYEKLKSSWPGVLYQLDVIHRA